MEQENTEQQRKPFYKRPWVWGAVVTFIIALTVSLITGFRNNPSSKKQETAKSTIVNQSNTSPELTPYAWGQRGFTDSQLSEAITALSHGVTVDDKENDYYRPPINTVEADGRPDNSNPFPIPFTDLKSISIGADLTYLYVKFQYWGEFPNQQISYSGEPIHTQIGKLIGFTFYNAAGRKDSAALSQSVVYVDKKVGQTPGEWKALPFGQLLSDYGITPLTQDLDGDDSYKTVSSDGTMVFGGPGYDYTIAAYPLDIFGLKLGDTITFNCIAETGSATYHFEARDPLNGAPNYVGDKHVGFGPLIQYVLGTNQHKNVD